MEDNLKIDKKRIKNKYFEIFEFIQIIITEQNNKMKVRIELKDSKIYVKCSLKLDYFKIEFVNNYTLNELKKKCDYFRQFNNLQDFIRELIYNDLNDKNYIEGNEYKSKEIRLIICLPNLMFQTIGFSLKKKIKNNNDILYEMRNVIETYMGKLKIDGFKSRILASDEKSKELIKLWISPNERLSAKLLYSFNIQYKKNRFLKQQYEYEFDSTVEDFHRKCDNKENILIICKSQKEVFGGYTPLCFTSEDEYGRDNESFLFSLNRCQKYPKSSFDNTKSIWKYRDYGPSFHYDLYFRERKMNIIKFEQTNYLTPERWINRENCFYNENGILLESLEIWKITYNNIIKYINEINDIIDFKGENKFNNTNYNNISNEINNINNNEISNNKISNNEINIINNNEISNNEINNFNNINNIDINDY